MNDFRQNRFPYHGAVAPVSTENLLFNEQCNEGVGNWSPAPGLTPTYPGFQDVPALYREWDPQSIINPAARPSCIDVNRGAWINQPVPPSAPSGNTHSWYGHVRSVGSWLADGEAFILQAVTRVGMLMQSSESPIAAPAGYGGVILSLEELYTGVDGPFIALAVREGENGQEATISKWADSATLVDVFAKPVPAGSVFLRVQMVIDPEDGATLQYAEYSLDGWGWELIGDELFLEREGFVNIAVGFAGTAFRDGSVRFMTTAVDFLQLRGPFADDSADEYALRLSTQGGRNWP